MTASFDSTSLLIIPKHVAIIPDGNRRWAQKQGWFFQSGHSKGADKTLEIALYAQELGVSYLSFFVFSTENWRRSRTEVSFLFDLMEKFIKTNLALMVERGVVLRHVGHGERLPESLQSTLLNGAAATQGGKGIHMQLMIDYGGRDEICRAYEKLFALGKSSVDERTLANFLDTAGLPEPELMVRTSGERRMSNFLLWQGSYSEWFFTDVLWPDFTKEHFLTALKDYQQRQRRWGGG